jgi:hypothetical protein
MKSSALLTTINGEIPPRRHPRLPRGAARPPGRSRHRPARSGRSTFPSPAPTPTTNPAWPQVCERAVAEGHLRHRLRRPLPRGHPRLPHRQKLAGTGLDTHLPCLDARSRPSPPPSSPSKCSPPASARISPALTRASSTPPSPAVTFDAELLARPSRQPSTPAANAASSTPSPSPARSSRVPSPDSAWRKP